MATTHTHHAPSTKLMLSTLIALPYYSIFYKYYISLANKNANSRSYQNSVSEKSTQFGSKTHSLIVVSPHFAEDESKASIPAGSYIE